MSGTPPNLQPSDARLELDASALFLVRVWRPVAGGFRASVRGSDDEAARQFSDPQEVARYLAGRLDDIGQHGKERS